MNLPGPGPHLPAGGPPVPDAELSPFAASGNRHYRLEALRANAGPNLFPRVYDTIEEACAFAELSLVVMGPHAGWKMTGYRIKEVETSRVVTTVNWHDPDDPNDQDPFA